MLNNSEQILSLVLLSIVALIINIPKYGHLIYVVKTNNKYKIFPWQENGFETITSPDWIGIHLFTAVLLYTVLSMYITLEKQELKYAIYFVHTLFSLVILFNFNRLGSLSSTMSSIVNIGMTILLTSLLWIDQIRIYILVLSIPIYMEIFAFIKHVLSKLIKNFFN